MSLLLLLNELINVWNTNLEILLVIIYFLPCLY